MFPARAYLLALAMLAPALCNAAADEDQWSLCKPRSETTLPSDLTDTRDDGATVITADEAETLDRDTVILHGDIRARQSKQHLRANSAIYHRSSDQLHADGNIEYFRPDLVIRGGDAEVSLDRNTGIINEASYDLISRHARGTAFSATLEKKDVTVLRQVTYTTCDIGDDAWMLRSSTLRLNQGNGVGTARNIRLSFMRVPFFYFPYLSFPIDDQRKTGLLPPSYAHSDENGTEVSLPFYINIAPQFDATLEPRYISKRGTMIKSEARYLNPIGHGQLNLEYLPDDDIASRNRTLVNFQDRSRYSTQLSSSISIAHVSDTEYFRDLGNSLSLSSITHLRQIASLDYQNDLWSSSLRLESYQTIDDTIPENRRPYQRLPQILFGTTRPDEDGEFNYNFSGEYVDFRHDIRISGSRIDLKPSIDYPIRTPATFAIPSISLRHTLYDLNESSAAGETHISRTVPSFTMDSGIFLERDSHWGLTPMIHTLEPRLYYLYSPFRDQTEIPLFDTALPDFSYSQLFRDNRFTGGDRIGDADQLTLALTTRFFEKETGKERLRASIGRIMYFKDREVSLGTLVEENNTSDLVAESAASLLPQLNTRFDVRWNEETHEIDKGSIQLQYEPDSRGIFNIAYRYRDPTLRQSDISILWPVGRRWNIIGRYNYSLLDHRALETLAGLEYQSCCWRVQIVNRRYVNDDLGDTRENLYIQFELKGLTSVGNSLESVLEEGILGYEK